MSGQRDEETEWRSDLMWAIEDEQLDQVGALAPGHDLNFIGEFGLTPLMAAVDAAADGANQRGRPRYVTAIELLLSLGASPTYKGRDGKDAADVARQYHWHEAIDAMHDADPDGVPILFWPLGYVDPDPQPTVVPPVEDTPWRAELMDAIKRTDIERVRRLLADRQGTLDFVHPGSRLTPLQLAISEQGNSERHRRRDPTIVRLLLDAGAAPDFPPDQWFSPLARADRWPEVAALLAARMRT